MRPLRQGSLRITDNRSGASENSLMVAVPWTGLPEPDGLMPDTADPPAPIRTFDDLLIAHQHLIDGALREVVRRGDDEGTWGGWSASLQRPCRKGPPSPPRHSRKRRLVCHGGMIECMCRFPVGGDPSSVKPHRRRSMSRFQALTSAVLDAELDRLRARLGLDPN